MRKTFKAACLCFIAWLAIGLVGLMNAPAALAQNAVPSFLGGYPQSVSPLSIAFTDGSGTASALASGGSTLAVFAPHDVGVAVGKPSQFSYFNAFFLTDQAGTAYIDGSADGVNWFTLTSQALTAATPQILRVPVMTRFHRTRVVNGSTAQTYLWVSCSYTAG